MKHQVAHSLSSSMSTSSVSSCVGEASNNNNNDNNNNNNVSNNNHMISFMHDEFVNCPLDEGSIGGYSSLHDLFQVLSEVPLHATATSPSPPQIVHEVTQGYQNNEEPKFKDIEVFKGNSKGKKLLEPEQSEVPYEHEHHDSSKRSLQRRTSEHRRRERINSKMRAIHALLPNCEKGDHASILDNAIKHIKSLQLQVDMMSRTLGQSQVQYPYAPQTIMQPPMLPTIGFGPCNWHSQLSPSAYHPFMVTQPSAIGVPIQPMTQAQTQAQAQAQAPAPAPFTSLFCPIQYLPTAITTPSTPTVLSFGPPLPQFTTPNSPEEPPTL